MWCFAWMFDRAARISVLRIWQLADKQIKTSEGGGVAFIDAATASISPRRDAGPCIFHFPAIKGRMSSSKLASQVTS
jgi:hypothetical protein